MGTALLEWLGRYGIEEGIQVTGKNSLYRNNLYEELREWEDMTLEITNGSDKIIDLKHKQI